MTSNTFKKRYYNHKTSFEDIRTMLNPLSCPNTFGTWKTRNVNSTSSCPFWSKHHPIAAAQRVATYTSKRNWKFWKVTRKDCWTGDVSYSRSVATGSNSWRENLNLRTQYHHASSLSNSHVIIQEFFYRDLNIVAWSSHWAWNPYSCDYILS